MDLQLTNKSVLITGSSKGIGFTLAKVLAAKVVISEFVRAMPVR